MNNNDIPCRITDEHVHNPWEGVDESKEPKSIAHLTLYELMAQECEVNLSYNRQSGYILDIENDNKDSFVEKGIHPEAIESLVSFCRRVIHDYEVIINDN